MDAQLKKDLKRLAKLGIINPRLELENIQTIKRNRYSTIMTGGLKAFKSEKPSRQIYKSPFPNLSETLSA